MRLRTLLLAGAAAYAWKRYSDTREPGATRRTREDDLDEALDETFPASDPPSMTASTTANIQPPRGGTAH